MAAGRVPQAPQSSACLESSSTALLGMAMAGASSSGSSYHIWAAFPGKKKKNQVLQVVLQPHCPALNIQENVLPNPPVAPRDLPTSWVETMEKKKKEMAEVEKEEKRRENQEQRRDEEFVGKATPNPSSLVGKREFGRFRRAMKRRRNGEKM
ncbi:uncharacterized protein LOC142074017 isoform X2 [Calonectris borealis]|uniref:uncharacterized protein LOC142074017 isoform X2 n=1 Tax=Calonectris borealis TaxID=1323832 RepID=UPI003F4C98D3